jgi:amphi-Trp domain-containing protein
MASVADGADDAVCRRGLAEDEEDVRAFEERADEKTVSLARVLKELKAKGRMKDRNHQAKGKSKRDIEKVYSTAQFVAKLRRFADALEQGKRFRIQITGQRVYVPVRAEFNVEHEREGDDEEIEFQIKWTKG